MKEHAKWVPVVSLLSLLLAGCYSNQEEVISFEARTQLITASAEWAVQEQPSDWKARETAIIITDMWDKHWCEGATRRVAEMAPRMNEVVQSARERGVLIVHAPSSVTDFYNDNPARRRVWDLPEVVPPEPIKDWYDPDPENEPALPIDDSDGGCDTCPDGQPCDNVNQSVWTRQIETIQIADEDAISDNGQEIHNVLKHHGIKNVIVMGVHTNMCVLGRPFGIRAQKAMGMNVVLVRDLTDAMYNPEMPPYVTHEEGTNLVIDHIEKYWAPTIHSTDLLSVYNAEKPGS